MHIHNVKPWHEVATHRKERSDNRQLDAADPPPDRNVSGSRPGDKDKKLSFPIDPAAEALIGKFGKISNS